jgi:hypothetical protein
VIQRIPALVLTDRDAMRFRVKVDPPDPNGCRLWNKSTDANGYGQFRLGPRVVKAHLVAWALTGQPFPLGLEPDHTCNIRRCTATEHLEWVTHQENNRRIGVRSERCRSGLHRWDEQIPIMNDDGRECRLCRNAGKRARYLATGRR